MSIISVTVSSDRHAIIGGAVRSAEPLVDGMLLLRLEDGTGNTASTVEAFVEAAKGKDCHATMPLNDDSQLVLARNAALCGVGTGSKHYDWAMILDTDERIVCHMSRDELHEALSQVPEHIDHVSIRSNTGYIKPRFFRLPVTGKFVGRIHEDWRTEGGHGLLRGITFRELPKEKTTAELQIPALVTQIHDEPENARWHYYLGAAYEALGMRAEAGRSFKQACVLAETGSEIQKWSRYRKVSIMTEFSRWQQYKCALSSLAYDAFYPEFLTHCANVAKRLEKWDDVLHWANLSILQGGVAKPDMLHARTMFMDVGACFDRPFKLRCLALQKLGAHPSVQEQERAKVQEVEKLRDRFLTGAM